jgi:hypothetical protein
VHRGVLNLFWDGREIRTIENLHHVGLLPPYNGTENLSADHWVDIALPTLQESGHYLDIEFSPSVRPETSWRDHELSFVTSETSWPKAMFRHLWVYMQDAFAVCEDMKACLQTLAEYKDSGLTLRSNNSLQQECLSRNFSEINASDSLNAAGVVEACNGWRQCLDSDALYQLRTLLDVAMSVSRAVDANTSASGERGNESNGSQVSHCIFPPSEDPESWNCDCHVEMYHECDALRAIDFDLSSFSDEDCIRANICRHPEVCPEWKVSQCSDNGTQKMVQALERAMINRADLAKTKSLLEHRSATLSESSSTMDSTLGGKRCW